MARRKTGLFPMSKYIVLLPFFALALTSQASEELVERSSHPRGIAVGGALPQMKPPNRSSPVAGSPQGGSVLPDRPIEGGHQSTGTGGVSVTGTTRIDARVQSGTATAVGDQNTAGNRVGSIGGK